MWPEQPSGQLLPRASYADPVTSLHRLDAYGLISAEETAASHGLRHALVCREGQRGPARATPARPDEMAVGGT